MTNFSKNNKNKQFNSFKKISGMKNKMLASRMAQPRGLLSGGRVEPVEANVTKSVRISSEEFEDYNGRKGVIRGLTEDRNKLVVEIEGVEERINFNPEELTGLEEPQNAVEGVVAAKEGLTGREVVEGNSEAEEKLAAAESRVREAEAKLAEALARAEKAEAAAAPTAERVRKLEAEKSAAAPAAAAAEEEMENQRRIAAESKEIPSSPEVPSAQSLDSQLTFHDFEQQLAAYPKKILLRNCPITGVSQLIENISKTQPMGEILNMFSQKPTYIFDHFKAGTSLMEIVSYYQFIRQDFIQRSTATTSLNMQVNPIYRYPYLKSYKYPTTLLEEKKIDDPGLYHISYQNDEDSLHLRRIFELDTDAEKTRAQYETTEVFSRKKAMKDYSWKDKGKNNENKRQRQFKIVYDSLNNMYLIAVSKEADKMVTDSSKGIDYTPLVAAGIINRPNYVDDTFRCRFVYYDARSSQDINLRFTDFTLDKGRDTDQIIDIFKIFYDNKDQRNMYLFHLNQICQNEFGINHDYSRKTGALYVGNLQDTKQKGFFGRGQKSIKNNLKLKSKSKSVKKH